MRKNDRFRVIFKDDSSLLIDFSDLANYRPILGDRDLVCALARSSSCSLVFITSLTSPAICLIPSIPSVFLSVSRLFSSVTPLF